MGGNVPYIVILVDTKSPQSSGYLIVQNIGRGTKMEDVLFDWKITAHYRYLGQEILGLAVLQADGATESFRDSLEMHTASVRAEDPEMANLLDSILSALPDRRKDLQFAEHLKNGTADGPTILEAIERRRWLRKSIPNELLSLAHGYGIPAGIAAALLNDDDRESEILAGQDTSAQRALLATARLVGEWLDKLQIFELMDSKHADIAEAAKRYWEIRAGVLF